MTLPRPAPRPAAAPPARACTVVLLADAPATGRTDGGRARRFALRGRTHSERSGRFIDFAVDEARAGRAVVALYPAWRPEAARRAVVHARSRTLSDEIAGIPLPLSPLALSVLADRLAGLAPVHPPGIVAAAARELPRHMLAGACLHSVAGLGALPTSTALHAASYLPGSTFLALSCPTAEVLRIPHGELGESLPPLPSPPDAPLQVSACSGTTGSAAFDDDLMPALRTATAHVVPSQPLGPVFWGTTRYTEFAAFESGPRSLARALGALRTVLCRWCGQQVDRKVCPFCRSRAHELPAASSSKAARRGVPAQRAPDGRPVPLPASTPGEPAVPAQRRPSAWPRPPEGLPLAPNGTPLPHPFAASEDTRE
ncbi:hypothetical protein O4J56_10810 [Nocardiopsis sp. RSe5-2]|uniref:Uncharacterized protein n=1 Tax=Nocardiopsis endophytica TaxID=3018445 RepID=A0ABT4U2F0_9ACTN|nr:hypothetical protein [Nocardiopsis endophytica]MDA2811127.1 hypothetical protein [Nocardiopsis endophytica]